MSEKESIIDFCNAVEAACVNLRMKLGDKPANNGPSGNSNIAVNEVTFTSLKFEATHGEKLGNYEIANKTSNPADKFEQAYNILKSSNATIKTRYRGKNYQFSYWLFSEGRIYRQKLKEQA